MPSKNTPPPIPPLTPLTQLIPWSNQQKWARKWTSDDTGTITHSQGKCHVFETLLGQKGYMELLFMKGERVLLHREQMWTHPHAFIIQLISWKSVAVSLRDSLWHKKLIDGNVSHWQLWKKVHFWPCVRESAVGYSGSMHEIRAFALFPILICPMSERRPLSTDCWSKPLAPPQAPGGHAIDLPQHFSFKPSALRKASWGPHQSLIYFSDCNSNESVDGYEFKSAH